MSSFLKRDHAPISEAAWKHVDAAAAYAVKTSLTARRVVDVEGPRGWEYSAVNLGRLDVTESAVEQVEYGVRRVKPLVELRARCELDIWELDNLSRGAADVDLAPVEEAARQVATFEDRALLLGLEDAGIKGLSGARAHDAIQLPLEPDGFLGTVSQGIVTLRRASIGGPFALVLGLEPHLFAASAPTGYPFLKRVRSLVEGPVLESHLIEGGLLVSLRGGDFVMSLGQDFAVGYETHDSRKVRLFITESFTFQIFEPKALMHFNLG